MKARHSILPSQLFTHAADDAGQLQLNTPLLEDRELSEHMRPPLHGWCRLLLFQRQLQPTGTKPAIGHRPLDGDGGSRGETKPGSHMPPPRTSFSFSTTVCVRAHTMSHSCVCSINSSKHRAVVLVVVLLAQGVCTGECSTCMTKSHILSHRKPCLHRYTHTHTYPAPSSSMDKPVITHTCIRKIKQCRVNAVLSERGLDRRQVQQPSG